VKKRICLSVLIAIALAFTLTGCRLLDIFNTITANDTDTITSEQELAFAQQYLEDNYDGIFVYKDKVYYDEIPEYLPHIGEPHLTTSYRFSELRENETYCVNITSQHVLDSIGIFDSDGNYDFDRSSLNLEVEVR
jgi:hypothetical protein